MPIASSMLLAFTLVVLVIWTALLLSVYSIFQPFIKDLWDIKDYNIAYYWAQSSIERALLSLKYHQWWYNASSGYSWVNNATVNFWNATDFKSATTLWKLSNLQSSMFWSINSQTLWTIPQAGQGNIEAGLAWTNSENFNRLDYNTAQEFLLSSDTTSSASNYYNNSITKTQFAWNRIEIKLRLPEKIRTAFWGSTLNTSADLGDDNIADDVVVNRTIAGNNGSQSLTVLPYSAVNYSSLSVLSQDSQIRESVINSMTIDSSVLDFTSSKNPIPLKSDPLQQNITPPGTSLATADFDDILATLTDTKLRLSLINNLLTSSWLIYPYLEYQIRFCSINCSTLVPVSDRFFTITWKSQVGNYNVDIQYKKPVSNTSAGSQYTILF